MKKLLSLLCCLVAATASGQIQSIFYGMDQARVSAQIESTLPSPAWWLSGSTNVTWKLVKNITLTNVADASACAYYPSNKSFFVVHNNSNGRITEWSLDGVCLRIIDWTAGQVPDAESITYLGGTQFAEVDEDFNRIFIFSITNGMPLAPLHATFDTNNCSIVAPPASVGTDPGSGAGVEGIAYDPDRKGWWLAREKSPAQLLFLDSLGATNNYFTDAQMATFTNANNTDFSDLFLDRRNQVLWVTQDETGQNDRILGISLVTSNIVATIPAPNFGQLEGISVLDDGTVLAAGEVNQFAIFQPALAGINSGMAYIRLTTNAPSVMTFPNGVVLTNIAAPVGVSNGIACLWNSNGFPFLRYSVAGWTTNCDKPLFP